MCRTDGTGMTATRHSVPAIIGRRLHDAGCRLAFGIPGGEVLALIEGLEAAGLRFVLAKHENCAGFMAEGAHHADGAPGVLVATLGPGVANAVNVVANAWQDRVPLIFLTGCVDPAEAHTYTHQVFDHGALLGPVTKASLTAVEGAVDVVIDKALAIATDGQPGPVHVDVPIAVAGTSQEVPENRRRVRVSPAAPAPGPDLDRARAWFGEARRPLMIAGVDVLNQGAAAAVETFVRDHRVPLITTYKAKGVVPEDDALCLGGAGLSPKADARLLPLVRQSDLILLAGYDPIEMRTGWRDPWDGVARVVEFSAVPNIHYMHQARIAFVGDVGAGLAALARDGGPAASWPDGEIAAARQALAEDFPTTEAWGPAAIIDCVRGAVPRNTVATVDSGAHRILLSQMWSCHEPRGLLQSTGLCTMGVALPLAVGYSLVAPQRPVVAFTGDAGLEMVLGELATLRNLKLPIIVVVFVDRSLGLIELKQRRSGLDNLGVDFEGTDFVAVAEALGGHGAECTERSHLQAEIEAALTRDGFTLLACPIGRRAYDGRF